MTILNMSDKDYEQLLQIIATELANKNKSSYELEFRELKSIDRYTLYLNIAASECFSFIDNLKFDDAERREKNEDAEDCVNFICNISNYINGTDEDKKFFIDLWIKIFSVSRISYSVEIMNKIKNLRIVKGLSQKQVANFLNISSQAYGHYENHKREPDLNTIVRLAQIFDVSIDYLVEHYLPKSLTGDFSLKNNQHVSKQKISQPVADFIMKLKSYNVDDDKFARLTDEQIKIIVSIIKQNI